MAEPFRLAVVGCGRMGRVHLRALRSLKDDSIDLVGCDPSAEALAWASAEEVPIFTSLAEAHDLKALDAVLIAAPTSLHLSLATEALVLGCAVLCEKPGGSSPTDLAHLGELAASLGRVLRLGYWHRFVPALRQARSAVAKGSLGDVLALYSAQWDGDPPSAGFLSSSVGELVDMGVHEIDAARWILGDRLAARGAAWRKTAEGHNAAVGVLQGARGTVVTVSAGRVLEGHKDACWIEVLGTKQSLFERWMWGAAGDEVNRRGVADQDREFVELVRSGDAGSHLATADEGAEVLRLATCLTEMARADWQGPGESGRAGGA